MDICMSSVSIWLLKVVCIIGSVYLGIKLVQFLLCYLLPRPAPSETQHVRVFSYKSLLDATQNFHQDCCIHEDMLGEVYIGHMLDSDQLFAIRRLHKCVHQTRKEFVDQVVQLYHANHPNLARLVGYCVLEDETDRLVVYEYPGKCLQNCLHESRPKELDLGVRMKIAAGVASALEYLHYVMKPQIVHCYVEPGNIWLDEEFNPVLSSFGLVRMFPKGKDYVGFSPHMSGSYWYTVGDYHSTKKITIKADVYGFGIFLFEIITGKKLKRSISSFVKNDGKKGVLDDWVKPYVEDKGAFVSEVDPMLEGTFDKYDLLEVLNIAVECLNTVVSRRPGMSEVLSRLNRLCHRVKQRHMKKTKKSKSRKVEKGVHKK